MKFNIYIGSWINIVITALPVFLIGVTGCQTRPIEHAFLNYYTRFTDSGISIGNEEIYWNFHLTDASGFDHLLDYQTDPSLSNDTVTYNRSQSVKEFYVLKADGYEQLFIIDQKPDPILEIRFKGVVNSNGEFKQDGKKYLWTKDGRSISFSKLIVYDYKGDQINSRLEVVHDQIEIVIDAIDLVDAEFPLVIDPVIGADDFRISVTGTDGNANQDAYSPKTAFNAIDDEYLIVWSADKTLDEDEIWGKIINANGSVIKNEFRISTMGPNGNTNYMAKNPDVIFNTENQEYLVVWSGDDGVDGEFEIYGQRLDANGLEIGVDDFRISDMGPNGDVNYQANYPKIEINTIANEYAIVWVGDDNTGTLVDNEEEIFGQMLNYDGSEKGINDFRITSIGVDGDPFDDALFPDLIYDSQNNKYLLTFAGLVNEYNIYLQGFTGGGPTAPNEIQISVDNGPGFHNVGAPQIINSFTNLGYLVIWDSDNAVDNVPYIYSRFVNESNYALTSIQTLITTSPGSSLRDAQITAGLNVLVLYLVGSSSIGDFEIYSRRYSLDMSSIFEAVQISNFGVSGDALGASLSNGHTFNSSVDYLVTWYGDKVIPPLVDNEFEIYGQFLRANFDPTDIGLTDNLLFENLSAGEVIGRFTLQDVENGTYSQYMLVPGVGDTDNGKFYTQLISCECSYFGETELISNSTFNFETQPTASIRIRGTDQVGGFFEKALTITIVNVNEPPTDIALTNNSIVENSSISTMIGNLSSTDPDVGDTFTYSLVPGFGDNASFTIMGNSLKVNELFNFEVKNSYSIKIRTMDAGGWTFEKEFTINILDGNDPPAVISIDQNFIDENLPSSTLIGNLSSIDEDPTDSHTYSLVPVGPDNDNGSFSIVGDQLLSQASFDFENQNSYSVEIEAIDNGGLSKIMMISIFINDMPDQPTDIVLSTSIVNENQPLSTLVGLLNSVDQDVGDSFSYALVPGVGDEDNGSFLIGSGNQLQTQSIFDYEVKSAYSIRVKTTDSGNNNFEKSIQVIIADINDSPTDIQLSSLNVEENKQVGTIVSFMTTVDQDILIDNNNDVFTYALVAGLGSEDNSSFTIDEDKLLTGEIFDIANKSTYSIRLRTLDKSSVQFEKSFSIQILEEQGVGASLTFSSGPTHQSEGNDFKIDVALTGGAGGREVKFFSRKVTGGTFLEETIQPVSGDEYQKTISKSAMDEIGLEYYFSAIDPSIPTPIETSHGFIYQKISANEITVPNLSFGGKRENYRIISIPHKLEDNLVQSIFGALGDYDKTKWRLVRYQNNKNEDFPAFNRIEQGKGYWFNSIENVEIKLGAGTSPENNQAKPFVLSLAAGWNQIGNPYPFDISWNDVLALNGNPTTVSGLYTYNSSNISFNKDVAILKAWEGGFVRADQAVNLTIPVTVKQTGGRQGRRNEIAGKKLDDSSWFVPITVTQGVAINQLGGFGMHPEASRSKDKFDEHSLPRFLNYLELNAYHNEYFMPKFTGDVVPTSENYTWDFVIESNFEGPTTQIQWDNLSLGVNDAQLLLVDVVENIIVDMKMNSYYVFSSSAKREFKVLFAIDEKHLQPQYTTVGKPYPNPFTSLVTLPILSAGNGHLQVAVYDMMGKQVKLLLNDVLPQGLHEVVWDGRDEQGSKVASGVYIYNMKVAGGPLQYGRLVVK